MNRLKIIYVILLVITLKANSQDCCNFVTKIQAYQGSVKIKHNTEPNILEPKTFNSNHYLSLFDKINFDKNYEYGVYYYDNFLDGNPYIYALRKGETLNTKDKDSLFQILNNEEFKAKEHVTPINTDLSYIQYLFFVEIGDRFALKWHSSKDRKYVICSKEDLDKRLIFYGMYLEKVVSEDVEIEEPLYSIKEKELRCLAAVNTNIIIKKSDDCYEISWIEDRPSYGVFRCTYQIRIDNYQIIKIHESKLMSTNGGITF